MKQTEIEQLETSDQNLSGKKSEKLASRKKERKTFLSK